MRLLPVKPLSNAPEFVMGFSLIRGEMLPVVNLAVLLKERSDAITRFVVVRAGDRKVALGVDAVIGTRNAEAVAMQNLPPLLSAAQPDLVKAISTLDNELLLLLQTGQLVPEEVWASMPALEQ